MTITFQSHDNYLAFMNQAEGQWLNYRDDNQEPEYSLVDRLMDDLNQVWSAFIDSNPDVHYPVSFTLSDTVREMAESVLENCVEYTQTWTPEDYDPDEPVIKEGEVTIL
jgi:hypothetical protein